MSLSTLSPESYAFRHSPVQVKVERLVQDYLALAERLRHMPSSQAHVVRGSLNALRHTLRHYRARQAQYNLLPELFSALPDDL